MNSRDIDVFRARGMWVLMGSGWACVIGLAAVGLMIGSADLGIVLMLAVAANLAPTMMVIRDRHDRTARLIMGTLAAVYPALGVYLLNGHP